MPISSYIQALRAKVGHDLLALQAVAVVVFDDQGRLLLAEDGDTGHWMLPGGAIDPNETPADAAVRECWEETGLLVEPTRLIGVFGGPDFCITYPNGDVVSYVMTAFEARLIGGEACPDGVEAVRLSYFTEEQTKHLPISPWNQLISACAFRRDERAYFSPPNWSPPE